MTLDDIKIVANNLGDFIEIPEGMEQIRKALLVLAVSGKIVSQDKKEGTAEELYKKILNERSKSNLNGQKQKKEVSLPEISIDDLPFEIPKSWKWVRLSEICDVQTGKKDANQGNINGNYNFYTCAQIPIRSNTYSFEGESLILPGNGANVGYVTYVNEKFEAYQRTYVLNNFKYINVEYVYKVLEAMWRDRMGKQYGGAINFIKIGNLNNFILPLPPIDEQNRIVIKIKELMKQFDALEVKKQQSDKLRTLLVRSAMYSLGNGKSKIAFENLTELIKTSDDIKELENALLSLAVSGKLVKQDKKDGTAEELYKKIQKEKVFKKQKIVIPISEKEIPFDIPNSWKWVRLADLGIINTGKTPKTASSENFNGNIPFIGPGDFGFGRIVSHSKLITEKGASESQYAHKDDVLMVCIGGTIGKSALVDSSVTFNQQINKITLYDSIGKYLYYVFISKYFQTLVWSKTTGGATPILNSSRWSECLIPLPPVVEQERIVKKVNEIMILINQLRDVIGGNKSHGRGRPKK